MLNIKIIILLASIAMAISGISLSSTQYTNSIDITEDDGRISQTNYNKIAYNDGYYYYQSSADNFYLYKADKSGKNKECLVKQVPKEIYVKDDWVYFTNASAGETLYKVRLDGSGLEQVVDRKIDRLVPVGDKFCFLEKQEVEKAEDKTGDSYTWNSRMKDPDINDKFLNKKILSWSEKEDIQLIYEGICIWLSTDGELLYVWGENEETNESCLKAVDLKGEVQTEKTEYPAYLRITDQNIYFISDNKISVMEKQNTLVKKEVNLPERKEAQVLAGFEVYKENFYVLIQDYSENSKKDSIIKYDSKLRSWKEIYSGVAWAYGLNIMRIESFYVLNNKIFLKNMKTEETGELWYWVDLTTEKISVFEDMEPFTGIVTNPNSDFPESSVENLEDDYVFEEIIDDGVGNDIYTNMKLPRINNNIPAYEKINQAVEQDRKNFYKERIKYADYIRDAAIEWHNESQGYLVYDYVYADQQYTSIIYEKFLGTSAMGLDIDYWGYVVKIYSSVTGEEIWIDDLFNKDFNDVMLRFCFAMRKTKLGLSYLNDDLDLLGGYGTKTLGYRCQYYTAKQGIGVFIVDRIRSGVNHFIISYDVLEDILVK